MRTSKGDYHVVNFNVPRPVIVKFDQLCSEMGRTRTSVLREEMMKFVRASETKKGALKIDFP